MRRAPAELPVVWAAAVRRAQAREPSIAGRFFRNIGSRSGSTTRTEFDLRLDDRIGAQPERLLRRPTSTPRQRGFSTPPSSGSSSISNALERPLRLMPSKVMTTTDFASNTPCDKPGDQPLVLLAPQRGKGKALEFAAVDGAKPGSGEPEDGFAARVLFQDERVGEQRLDVGRLDFGPLRAPGGRPAAGSNTGTTRSIRPVSCYLLRAICRQVCHR